MAIGPIKLFKNMTPEQTIRSVEKTKRNIKKGTAKALKGSR